MGRVSLSDDDRSALADLERRLVRDDPGLSDRFRRHGAGLEAGSGDLHVGGILFVVGLVTLLVTLQGPIAIPLAGVGAMYAGALLVTRFARGRLARVRATWRGRFDVPAAERYGYRP